MVLVDNPGCVPGSVEGLLSEFQWVDIHQKKKEIGSRSFGSEAKGWQMFVC